MNTKTKPRLKQPEVNYASNIVQDLRIPAYGQIAALESFLSTSSKKLDEEEHDLIKLTLNSCVYMQGIIEMFTSFEDMAIREMKPYYEKFDIIKLLKRVIGQVEILMKYNKVTLELNFPETLYTNADKLEMRRVLFYILTDIASSAYEGSTITINVHSNSTKNELIFEIRSKSKHLSQEIVDEIFEKDKVHQSRFSKTCLGLSYYMARQIIHSHYGRISFTSYPSNTTIVNICIPLL